MTLDRHEDWLKSHEKRIGSLEVRQGVLIDNMNTIRKLGYAGITLLSGIFLTLLAAVLTLLTSGWLK